MTAYETEIAVLERVRASLTAEGYNVLVHPSALQLPEFLAELRPDAIATRDDGNLVIEVMSRSSASEQKLRRFTSAIANKEGWSLRTIWTSGHSVPSALKPPSKSAVAETLSRIDALIGASEYGAALLLSWAVLEGVSRRILGNTVGRPQTPRRLIEQLAQAGHLKTSEAKRLRESADLRNRLIHGELSVSLSPSVIIEFRTILGRLSK